LCTLAAEMTAGDPDEGVEQPALDTLRRWESAGGHWQVVARIPSGLIVALLRCDGGEEAHRIASADPALAAYIGDRESSA
jgi:hypothetical protein